jgi:hypothetical protein
MNRPCHASAAISGLLGRLIVAGGFGFQLCSAHLLGATYHIETGSGQSLSTAVVEHFPTVSPGTLEFGMGFATQEPFATSYIFDSATLTLQDASGTTTAVYLTVDRAGITEAPVTLGGIPLDPQDFVRTELAISDSSQSWAYQTWFNMSVPVPVEFAGAPAHLYLDLFDNLDTHISSVWFSDVPLGVPEPAVPALIACGVAICARRRLRDPGLCGRAP